MPNKLQYTMEEKDTDVTLKKPQERIFCSSEKAATTTTLFKYNQVRNRKTLPNANTLYL